MKKHTLSLILPIMMAATSTTAASDSHYPFNGYYAGISAGESLLAGTANQTKNINLPSAGYNINDSKGASLKRNSVVGAVHAGYSYTWEEWYLGGEAFIKSSRNKASISDTTTFSQNVAGNSTTLGVSSNFRTTLRNIEFGVDFRSGYLVTHHSLLYVRIGAAFNKLSLSSNMTFSRQNPRLEQASFPLSQANNKTKTALRLGTGLEQQICKYWTVHADYTYTYYGRINTTNSINGESLNPVGPVSALLSNTAKAKVSNHTVMLGLSHYW